MILLAKELPDLRDRLAEWSDGPNAHFMFGVGIRASEPDLTEDGLQVMAKMFAHLDAVTFRDADLLHVNPSMVELLLQARHGIGEAGFMDYDLPTPVGMAYFAVELDAVNKAAALLEEAERLNPQLAGAGIEEVGWSPEQMAFAKVDQREHLLCVWRVMAPQLPEYPHGYVHLSWWFERDAWWDNHHRMSAALGKTIRPVVPGVVPRFIPDGHQAIAFHPDSAGVRVDFTGGGTMADKERRPEMFRALCYLLRQRIAESETVMPDRAARRRMAREGREPAPVRVISLRGASAHGGGDGSREYVHRWMVRGHWRRQWYPSIQQNRPIWITPYIKGPDDAPLLGGEKVYSVQARSADHGC